MPEFTNDRSRANPRTTMQIVMHWPTLKTKTVLQSHKKKGQIFGKALAPAVKYYLDNLYQDHSKLRLCEGNWKAVCLATNVYPGWARRRKDLRGASDVVKSEPGNVVKVESSEVKHKVQGTLKHKDPPVPSTGCAKQVKKMEEDVAASSQEILLMTAITPESTAVPIKAQTLLQLSYPQAGQPIIDPILLNLPSSIAHTSASPIDDTIRELANPPSKTTVSGSSFIYCVLELTLVLLLFELILVDPFKPSQSNRSLSRLSAVNGHSDIKPRPTITTTKSLSHNIPLPDSAHSIASNSILLNLVSSPADFTTLSGVIPSTVPFATSSNQIPWPAVIVASPNPGPSTAAISTSSNLGPPSAASPLFKPSKSCSKLNLFGIEYCKTHIRPTSTEVRMALEALSMADRLHWTKLRAKKLAAKKGL
ncbi:hypothetical protein B0H34DRAFT_801960 [Crassisporium funariophilum]|nr:hypothetical protein B0H34DRAFT_801960 [Crassisporium funariophilum]